MGIVAYLESLGVQVKYAKGGWQPVKCPYHGDRTASASVNTTTDRFHCFACDISEDLVGLIRKDTGMGYVEAKQEAENKYGQGASTVGGESDSGQGLSGIAGHFRRNGEGFQSWRSGLR